MNTIKETRMPANPWAMRLLISGVLCLSPALLFGQVQSTNTATTTGTGTAADASTRAAAPATQYAPGVEEIIKLSDAKLSKDVMLKFVQTYNLIAYPTSSEVLAMKKHDVPDEVIVAFYDRGAVMEKEGMAVERNRKVAVPAIVSALSTEGEMDPDSYDFWWYHYAYPRSLSYSYKTLTPYLPQANYYNNTPYYPRSYAGYGSFPYSSRYSTGRSRLSSSRVQYGTLPPNSARHHSFSVPSGTMTLRNRGAR